MGFGFVMQHRFLSVGEGEGGRGRVANRKMKSVSTPIFIGAGATEDGTKTIDD